MYGSYVKKRLSIFPFFLSKNTMRANVRRLTNAWMNGVILVCVLLPMLPIFQGCSAGTSTASSQSSGSSSSGSSSSGGTDKSPPTVVIASPKDGATVSSAITITATASDPDSPVAFVQLLLDGADLGSHLASSPYSFSWNTVTAANGAHTLTAIAQDPAGNQGTSAPVSITVSNSTSSTGATGPLRPLASNPNYFIDGSGKAILLIGSHTWNDFQDLGSTTPQSIDFNAFVSFLVMHHHNATVLWRKDLPQYCGWGAGGVWTINSTTGFPWARPGPGTASDGLPKWDLNTFNNTYFTRLLARVQQLQQNDIYAVVQLFDGLQLAGNRCGTTNPTGDGYPFTLVNNVNGIDDGYTSGGSGDASMTMGARNAITDAQEAFVKKMVDTLNDQPNVIWEISEEAPSNSTWWQNFMIDLLHTYEGGGTFTETGEAFTPKPFKHPVDFPGYQGGDSVMVSSNADMMSTIAKISALATTYCSAGTPACKVNVNDSDHSYFGMWNDSAQTNRQYLWENITNGNGVFFMDPYTIFAGPSNPNWTNRNNCSGGSNGVCTGLDNRWENFRQNLGQAQLYANERMNLANATPKPSLSSTLFCLAQTPAMGAEYLVYAPNGGSFTVNLTAMSSSRTLNVEWFNPSIGTTTPGSPVPAGALHSFATPFSGDAVLYLVDSAGHN